jgi:hypothetical protein
VEIERTADHIDFAWNDANIHAQELQDADTECFFTTCLPCNLTESQQEEWRKDKMKHLFEVYLKHPETGESGWEIVWLHGTYDAVHSYPDFDCIITIDDPSCKKDIISV